MKKEILNGTRIPYELSVEELGKMLSSPIKCTINPKIKLITKNIQKHSILIHFIEMVLLIVSKEKNLILFT